MKTFLLFTAAMALFSFSKANIDEKCDLTFPIDGGIGCNYNGATHGWCSLGEFQEYANNVYDLETCTPKNAR